jgi:hypothetical protein
MRSGIHICQWGGRENGARERESEVEGSLGRNGLWGGREYYGHGIGRKGAWGGREAPGGGSLREPTEYGADPWTDRRGYQPALTPNTGNKSTIIKFILLKEKR